MIVFFFFFQAEDGIRDRNVTGVQTCALPISPSASGTAKCTSPVRSRAMTKPPRAKASATQLQGESGAREKGHPTPAAASSGGFEIDGALACNRLHVGRGLMVAPIRRPAASAR